MSPTPNPEAWKNPVTIDTLASRHYQDDLPFHNYPHTLEVAERVFELAEIAIAHGVDIERDVLKPASSYHDVGAHLHLDDPILINFASREEYASDIAGRELRMLHMPEPLVRLTGDVIESTNPVVPCATDTARCFRQADLSAGGLLSDPINFLRGTSRLYREAKKLKGEPLISPRNPGKLIKDFVAFGGVSYEILNAYLDEDISLGDFQRDAEGKSLFAVRAAKNVELLLPKRLTKILTAHLGDIISYEPTGV